MDEKCHHLKVKKFRILAERCKNCGVCLEKCPEGAIARNHADICEILEDSCSFCGICKEVCQVQAVKETFSAWLFWKHLLGGEGCVQCLK